MQKILKAMFVMFAFLVLNASCSYAADVTGYIPHKVIVQFEENFSSNNPPQNFSVVMNDSYTVKNVRTVEKGTQLFFEVTKVNKEKRGKLNASVEARAVKVYIPSQDKTIEINNPNAVVKFSKYEPVDKLDKISDAGISVANAFVSNITYPAHFVKGVVRNEQGNRLKSGLKETYDSSILGYTQKGEPLNVKAGGLATLTFYTKNITTDNATTDNNNVSE